MEPSIVGRVPALPWSAGDGDGLCGVDHLVEHLGGKDDLPLLAWSGARTQLWPDQVLVAAHGGFRMVAPPIPGHMLPADAAPFGQELDVAVARGLRVRISGAQYRVGPGRDDHLGW